MVRIGKGVKFEVKLMPLIRCSGMEIIVKSYVLDDDLELSLVNIFSLMVRQVNNQ